MHEKIKEEPDQGKGSFVHFQPELTIFKLIG